MSYQEFASYFVLEAIAVWMIARAYERWSHRRYSDAAARMKAKYQSHLSRTASPARTSKQ